MTSKAKVDALDYDDRQRDIEEITGSPPLPIDVEAVEREIEVIAVEIEITQTVAAAKIGEKLAEAREKFRYARKFGGFSGWIKTRLGRSDEWARRAIAVAECARDQKFQAVLELLPPTAQAEFATAPKDVQNKAEALLIDGQRVTAADFKRMKSEASVAKRRMMSPSWGFGADLERAKAKGAAEAEARLNARIGELAAEKAAADQRVATLQSQIEGAEARPDGAQPARPAAAIASTKPTDLSGDEVQQAVTIDRMRALAESIRKLARLDVSPTLFWLEMERAGIRRDGHMDVVRSIEMLTELDRVHRVGWGDE